MQVLQGQEDLCSIEPRLLFAELSLSERGGGKGIERGKTKGKQLRYSLAMVGEKFASQHERNYQV